ncbi:hypothetical protein X808_9110 [Mannheimia varigena USDA-ARS-USMARC-1296]|uniref:Phage-Barnase-EndoU-ColicinE5/D-RelE-like nuclease domain-containing protein n=1 Tax=Mannheimia varigena USDA-ARS-USMARC-1296 TaxID=1433287 RepID=W0Q976_9PAST|nr:hypothetical protein [Mannheimia varigena]AHG75434.1 hypothetical protein X808_9110 [Mannheimia varigena USDA-ARS-USMARC-1296]
MQLTQSHIQRINRLWRVISLDSKDWNESKHPRAANGQFGKGGSQSAMKSVKANIGRGRSAMNTAIAEKRTVHRAMYHNELGWIDFEWGNTGKIKASGKTKGAMGISHIIESRMRKDNLSYEQATKMLTKNVVETIAKGKTVDKFEKGNVTALKIDHEKCRVSLRKSKGSNAWIITAFELFEDAGSKGDGKTTATEHQSYSARIDAGASNKNSITPRTISNQAKIRINSLFQRNR